VRKHIDESGQVREGPPPGAMSDAELYAALQVPPPGSRRADYQRYLRSRAWQEAKRRYERSERPSKCAWCGKGRYELHHLRYDRLGTEPPEDLIALCARHHGALHAVLAGRKSSRIIPKGMRRWIPRELLRASKRVRYRPQGGGRARPASGDCGELSA
jgi:hypothetical protein